MPNLIDFEWGRAADGYEIVWPKPKAAGEKRGTRIITGDVGPTLEPKSDRTIRYRPLDEHPALFKEFAELDSSPEAILEFANKYGLLNDDGPPCRLWNDGIITLKAAVILWERGAEEPFIQAWNATKLGQISIKLVCRGQKETPGLAMVPSSLESAMYIQLAQAITGNRGLQRCLWCATWFLFGAGTGRRKSAHYCSDHCRKVAHRHRKEGSK